MNLQQLSEKDLLTLLSAVKTELQARHEEDEEFEELEEAVSAACEYCNQDPDEIHDLAIDTYHS